MKRKFLIAMSLSLTCCFLSICNGSRGDDVRLEPFFLKPGETSFEVMISKQQAVNQINEMIHSTPTKEMHNVTSNLPIADTISMDYLTEGGIQDLSWDGSHLWGIDGCSFDKLHYISKIDPVDGSIVDFFSAPNFSTEAHGAIGIACGDGYLWIVNYKDYVIYAVNPKTGHVDYEKSISLVNFESIVSGGAWDGEYLWFGEWDYYEGKATIYKVDVYSLEIITVQHVPAQFIHDLEFAQGYLWVTVGNLYGDHYIYKIDPESNTILDQYNRSPCTYGLAYDGKYLWASDWGVSCRYYKYLMASENTTTTATPANSTTTTSTKTAICPSVEIYGRGSKEVTLLRAIRDNVLIETPEGQEIIRLYYRWIPLVVKAMEEDDQFKAEVKEVIDEMLSIIKEAVK